MFQENSIKTYILSRVKQITSPDWMHETSARTWCTGKTQRDRAEREVGGGIGMGNTCKPMADSFQRMTKPTPIKKKKKKGVRAGSCLGHPGRRRRRRAWRCRGARRAGPEEAADRSGEAEGRGSLLPLFSGAFMTGRCLLT